MATPAATGLKIWACTIFFNAMILGIKSVLTLDPEGAAIAGISLFAGLFIAAPFLPLFMLMVKVSAKLPYGDPARKIWLGFMLGVLVVLIFLPLTLFAESYFGRNVYVMAGIALISLFVSMLCVPQSLKDVYSQPNKNES